MKRAIMVILAAGVILTGLCSGCGGKFTRQRYETIYASMPDWRVRKVLGKPDATTADTWSYVRRQPYYAATVKFQDGHVVDKSWSVEKPKAQSK